jgi:hypothetical protein
MERRDLFRILPAAAIAGRTALAQTAHNHSVVEEPPKIYKPRAFSPEEYALLDRLTETLLPADEDGPGASEARVPFYIDTLLFYGDSKQRDRWREGLKLIDGEARERFGKSFVDLARAEQDKIFEILTQTESSPKRELEKFFTVFKRTTIDGFFMSDVTQKRYLHYTGNTAIDEFTGCA